MERHILKRKLQIIIFELTTPLASLSGFCDLTKDRIKSQLVLNQLAAIKEATEYIKSKKGYLSEKNLIKNDPDFSSDIKAASYLRTFALELQIYENTISASVDRLLKYDFEAGEPSFDEWAKRLLTTASENLSEKIKALRTIKPDLELVIPKTRE